VVRGANRRRPAGLLTLTLSSADRGEGKQSVLACGSIYIANHGDRRLAGAAGGATMAGLPPPSDQPAVSVLMPVRDAARTLDQAMASVVAQTLSEIEIVAVDDGSTDGSGERLSAWAARDRRVRVLRRPARGLVAALNEGLAACRASLVARMDADDLCHPERLAAQHAFMLDHPAVGVVGTLVDGCTLDGQPLAPGMARYLAWSNRLCEPQAIARERFIESPLVHPSVVARRAVLDAGYRAGPFPEDYDLWLRLLCQGVAMAKVPRVLLTWRDRPDRATRRDPRYAPARHRALKIAALLDGPLARRRPVLLWGAGLEGKPFLRALRERGCLIPAVVEVDPRKLGNRIHGAAVVPSAALPGLLAAHPDALVLVAVGVPRARDEIRGVLEPLGLVEGQSFFFLC
jgi:GT2 family glycosyltransferase